MRLVIESSAQQMNHANDPLAEKKLQLEIESLGSTDESAGVCGEELIAWRWDVSPTV